MAPVGLFMLMAALAGLGFAVGRWLGRNAGLRAGVWVALAVLLLGVWSWLSYRPDVAVKAIPASILIYIEGTASTPIFMLILGIAWARSRLARQRRVTMLAMALGVLYFINGGFWMLQTTPERGFAETLRNGRLVLQSQDFSCVPAACASALNVLGVPTTESQMADLTQTRPGTGATILRAVDGLEQRLAGTPWRVELVEADPTQLQTLPMPAVTALQAEHARRHMVAVLAVTPKGALVADPMDGVVWMPREEFEAVYTWQVIVFRR